MTSKSYAIADVAKFCITDITFSTGATESVAFIEHIMERIAFTTKKDPVAIRLQHLSQDNMAMIDIVNGFKHDCSYDERKAEIAKFNQDNAWKKRALKVGLMAYPISKFRNHPYTNP